MELSPPQTLEHPPSQRSDGVPDHMDVDEPPPPIGSQPQQESQSSAGRKRSHEGNGARQAAAGEQEEGGGEEEEEDEEEEEPAEQPGKATEQGKQTRMERDTIKKDRSLAELLLVMDEYKPVIPDAVTDYYLTRSGFECDDPRVKRLLALAAQKFVSDIAVDALQYSKIRGQNASDKKDRRSTAKDRRTVLTMEDLSAALADHGVNVKKPEYYL
ncbi:Transcription initiation factor TFIID subunit 10 [Geranomyces variabilis]|uniref:Transcription initiation factor TFIID subunit 10 n=1 Tax=Geranomyces variabilis TaxID=109894 RepID=A0AAD5TFJ6_9FUNG|nr:Transcription initiation factor TFIID subunit 10 [Geranomyces variabilis]